MSERSPTGGGAVSGTNSKKYHGYGSRERQVLGDTEELRDNIFVFGRRDQTEMYLKTVDALADYAQSKFDMNIKILVRDGVEMTLEEPEAPKADAGKEVPRSDMERFKAKLGEYHLKMRMYEERKQNMFQVILGQCSLPIRNKLNNDTSVRELEQKSDVAGLLTKIKTMVFSMERVQHPYWTAQAGLRRFAALNQGPSESTDAYYKRVLSNVKVLEEQWGPLYPEKLCTNKSDKKKIAKTQEQFIAVHFLAGADKKRYDKLLIELNNSFIAGKDNYPATLEAAYQLLCHFQDHKLGGSNGHGNSSELSGSTFAQVRKKLEKMRCFRCNELGHLARDCPTNNQNNNQVEESKESDDNSGSRQRIAPWRRAGT